MSTAAWAFFVIATIVPSALCVAIAVLHSKMLSRALAHADNIHARTANQLQDMNDRFMAINFAEYKSFKLAEDSPQGEWEPPDTAMFEDQLRQVETRS